MWLCMQVVFLASLEGREMRGRQREGTRVQYLASTPELSTLSEQHNLTQLEVCTPSSTLCCV